MAAATAVSRAADADAEVVVELMPEREPPPLAPAGSAASEGEQEAAGGAAGEPSSAGVDAAAAEQARNPRGRPLGSSNARTFVVGNSLRRRRMRRLVMRLTRLQKQLEDETGAMSLVLVAPDAETEPTMLVSADMQFAAGNKVIIDQFREHVRVSDARRKSDPKRAEALRRLDRMTPGDTIDPGDDGEGDTDVALASADDEEKKLQEQFISPATFATPDGADAAPQQPILQFHHMTGLGAAAASLDPEPLPVIEDGDENQPTSNNRKLLRNQVAHLVQRLNGGKRLLFKGEPPDFWPSHIKFIAPSAIDAPTTLRELMMHLIEQIRMRPSAQMVMPDFRGVIRKVPTPPKKRARIQSGTALGAAGFQGTPTVVVTPIDTSVVGQPLETAVGVADTGTKRGAEDDYPDWRLNRSMYAQPEME